MATQLQITDETPIAMLTVGQQRELFKEWFKELSGDNKSAPTSSVQSSKRYVYGIAGIATLFQTSYATAQKLKDGVLQPAIYQQGRKIMVDADLAMELFRQNKNTPK
jgi:hypothetical protein